MKKNLVFLFFYLTFLAPLVAQNLRQEFEQLWKSEDVYQKAHALSKLAQMDSPESAKLLIASLEKIVKPLSKAEQAVEEEQQKLQSAENEFSRNLIQEKLNTLSKTMESYQIFLEKTTRAVGSFKNPTAIQYLLKNGLDSKSDRIKVAILQGFMRFKAEETTPVFFKALKDPSAPVRLAVVIALQKNTTSEVSEMLFKLLKEPDPSWQVRCRASAILMQRNVADAYPFFVREFLTVGKLDLPEATSFLTDFLKMPEAGAEDEFFPPVRQMAILALQQRLPPEGFEPILKLLADPVWQVRTCVAKTLMNYDNPLAIEPLIEQLDKEKGRLVDDMEEALHFLTGETHQGNATVWRIRFKSEYERWKRKEKKNPPKRIDRRLRGTAQYYPDKATTKEASIVLTTNSERILYVVDFSNSMASKILPESASEEARRLAPSKIRLLKNKLIQTLPKLKENQSFSMIIFHDKTFCWKKELVPATKANIQEAQEYIQQTTTEGNTDTFSALEKAFYLEESGLPHLAKDFYKNYQTGPDVIFLISDGLPTVGKYKVDYWNEKNSQSSILKFLDAVEEMNLLRCIKIHTIGIPPDPLDDLLGGLAADSSGTYQYWE